LYNLNEVIMRSSVGYGSYAMDGMFGDEIDELGPPPQLYTEAIEVGPDDAAEQSLIQQSQSSDPTVARAAREQLYERNVAACKGGECSAEDAASLIRVETRRQQEKQRRMMYIMGGSAAVLITGIILYFTVFTKP
jgi:hypothetical protein